MKYQLTPSGRLIKYETNILSKSRLGLTGELKSNGLA